MKLKELYPYETAGSAFDVDYRWLYEQGFRGLIFDIDNTLVHHGDDATPEVEALMRDLRDMGFQIAFVTDNDEERVLRFIRNIDAVYVCDAGKPSRDGFLKAAELMGLDRGQIVCLGDQMFKDVLGANRAGMANVLVKFIRLDSEKRIGKKRYLEKAVLALYRFTKADRRLGGVDVKAENPSTAENLGRFARHEILFSDINPLSYHISAKKETAKRHLQNLLRPLPYASEKRTEPLANLVYAYSCGLIKQGKDIDPVLQWNKADNIALAAGTIHGMILHPGEYFSFWRCVGKMTRRRGYKDGRVIEAGVTHPGLGGGLCNLGNALHLLALHSPLDVVEVHYHSDALSPDHGERVPFSAGTSVAYNYIDLRLRNNTSDDYQILVWRDGETLRAELRCDRPESRRYELREEGHHFQREGKEIYRVSKIYRDTFDNASGELLETRLIRDNHSLVMFDHDMLPQDAVR
ncbi:MAG: HAD-IIIA family hydrolase [Ruminococcaceae bacterium]|nr:HAD-IIIA family hydrolase [Oscillospiraceae bacterium]